MCSDVDAEELRNSWNCSVGTSDHKAGDADRGSRGGVGMTTTCSFQTRVTSIKVTGIYLFRAFKSNELQNKWVRTMVILVHAWCLTGLREIELQYGE